MKNKIIIAVAVMIVVAIMATYFLVNRTSSPTTLLIDPQNVQGAVGQDFTVDIKVSDVAGLYGWELKVGWNATVLEVVSVTEGAFLRARGSTFFTYNNTWFPLGYVLVDCTLIGDTEGMNGSGVLASIQFHVKQAGNCDIRLYDTKLIDADEMMIAHAANGGRFTTGSY